MIFDFFPVVYPRECYIVMGLVPHVVLVFLHILAVAAFLFFALSGGGWGDVYVGDGRGLLCCGFLALFGGRLGASTLVTVMVCSTGGTLQFLVGGVEDDDAGTETFKPLVHVLLRQFWAYVAVLRIKTIVQRIIPHNKHLGLRPSNCSSLFEARLEGYL